MPRYTFNFGYAFIFGYRPLHFSLHFHFLPLTCLKIKLAQNKKRSKKEEKNHRKRGKEKKL